MSAPVSCPYCGAEPSAEEEALIGKHGWLTCPTCAREGCSECMPAGRGCTCPQCEATGGNEL